ncbi:phage tail tape measure protein [uncultured Algoriphagus sp.]|uniref:phage tail tape measure protein n=1 Tax=uncultured Algoriphagus sp. TaxID=417365 RepID=UPI002588C8E4|nr:phage tail tape measure protein [uncultured Algoriphagus sp.]
MGKKLRDEDLVLNIIVNGDQGKKEIGELERSIKDTTSELRALERQQKALAQQNKKDTKEYKAVTAAIKQKNNAISLAESRLKQLRSEMDINTMSASDLRREMNRIRRLRDIAPPLTEEWKKHDERLTQVSTRYNELTGRAQKTGMSIQNLAGKFNHYIGVITAGLATFYTAISGVRAAITAYAEFDDKVADVMKTTGMLKGEVLEMNESLKSLDTRTAQEDLLGLGRVAGKLGIEGRENVEGFIRSADKIVVALKEDLGGDVEDSINAVGKLVDIFNIDEEVPLEQALLKVGSSINELGAASTANEGFLVEFTKRTAGMAPSARISITEILGLAATLDQLGQTSEVSSTTFNNLIPKMFTNTAEFAKLAGMSIEDFSDLLNKDANEAFIRFLEGVRGNNSGLSEMINNMGDLGIDGARATSVIAVLANNTETLRQQQDLANVSFAEGTSLTDEFNVKNETAAAKLEKARKGLQAMVVELGEKLMPVMTMSTSGFSYFVRILTSALDFFMKNRTAILSLVAAVAAYNAVVFIQNKQAQASILLAKAKIFWDNAQLIATQLLAAAQMLLTGNLKGAAQAMRIVNSVAAANPYAAVAALVIGLGVAVYNWSKSLTAAEKAQRAVNEISREAEKSVIRERLEIEKLIAVAQDKTRSDEERLAALQKLNQISPDYFSNLNLETVNTEAAKKATDDYINSLIRKARVQAAEEKLVELEKRKLDLAKESSDLSFWENLQAFVTGKSNVIASKFAEGAKEIREQEQLLSAFIKENTDRPDLNLNTNTTGGGGSPEQITTIQSLNDKLKKLQEDREKINVVDTESLRKNAEEQKRIQDELAKYQIQSSTKVSKAKTDQRIKEDREAEALLQRQQEYQQRVLESQLSFIEQENLAHQRRLEQAGLAGKRREEMTDQEFQVFEALQLQFYDNLSTIDAQAMQKALEQKQYGFERELEALRISHNEQFKEVKTMAQARALLEDELSADALAGIQNMRQAQREIDKKFQREEEELMRRHLESLQAELEQSLATGTFQGIDLADQVLSDEEVQVLEEKLAQVKLLLSEMGLGSGTEIAEDRGLRARNVDVLGFTPEDWEIFFERMEAGKTGINELVMGAQAMISAYAQYATFVNAGEKRELAEFERSNEKKKQALKTRLDQGYISQNQYTQQVAALDADLERKKAEHDRNAAKRERNVALMSAIVNTASAIAAALPNVALSILVGAMGALQIGTIMRTPLPEIPGAEDGGFLDVVRSQDGRRFRARKRANHRGFVDRPTVITGESGREFVASNEAVNNPTVAPVLDAIDTAQRLGQISSLNLFRVLEENRELRRAIPGRRKGGRLSSETATDSPTSSGMGMGFYPEIMVMIKSNTKAINQLNERLRRPIAADVSITGKRGLEERQKELEAIRKDATL